MVVPLARVYPPINAEAALIQTLEDIDNLRDREEGWDGYEAPRPHPLHVAFSKIWAIRFYLHLKAHGMEFCSPYVSSDEEGEVSFEWWSVKQPVGQPMGRRKLTIYLNAWEAPKVWFIKSWGAHMQLEMEDGEATIEESGLLWEDFITGYERSESGRG